MKYLVFIMLLVVSLALPAYARCPVDDCYVFAQMEVDRCIEDEEPEDMQYCLQMAQMQLDSCLNGCRMEN